MRITLLPYNEKDKNNMETGVQVSISHGNLSRNLQ
jgi:hypothetical protein